MQKFILSVTVALGLLLSSVATLAQPQIVWVETKGDAIPATAVAAGNEANGEKLFMCRMTNAAPPERRTLQPGKTRRGFGACNFHQDGFEFGSYVYEVAVALPAGAKWQRTEASNIPPTAIVAGQSGITVSIPRNIPLYFCRANYRGGVHIGNTRPGFNGCGFGWGGRQISIRNYEILVAPVGTFMGCQQMSNTLGTHHEITWGNANPAQQQQWAANGCTTKPQFMGCQQMSDTLGTNAGITWGSATPAQQQQWTANGCTTKPQTARNIVRPW
ncbi:DM9 repeat-containing protein [Limnohabitans sp.]|jgi:hypothetical protein|uniref:DM9 repeat-containing protein n=1 Tax=Limnohabitans sp. TaxID=1907725 RepID=UPI0037BFE91D